MSRSAAHIFVKFGDARNEVEVVLREVSPTAPPNAGYQKMLYVTRADQTVVFLSSPDAAMARALRGRPGWREPDVEE